jgi:hypothetical protein
VGPPPVSRARGAEIWLPICSHFSRATSGIVPFGIPLAFGLGGAGACAILIDANANASHPKSSPNRGEKP